MPLVTENEELRKQLAALEAELEQHNDALVAVDMARKEGLRKLQAAQAEIAQYKQDAERWKEYAQHQEICADCAESVSDCDVGVRLRDAAMKEAK